MASGTQYFIFNREQDWHNGGLIEHAAFEEDELCSTQEQLWFFSEAFDTMQTETCWHRLRMDAKIAQNALVELYLMATDASEEEETVISRKFTDINVSKAEKLQIFQEYGEKFTNITDVPLFAFVGRYLWIGIHIVSHGTEPVHIRSLKLEFPRIAFIDYLPQIFRKQGKNSFLSRYLMIFQSIYVDFEEELERTPRLFDVKTAPEEFLQWLTEWFGLKDSTQWSEDKLRTLLQHAVELYRKKGTCDSIRHMAEYYTGETPLLVEQFNVVKAETAPEKQSLIRKLYGDNEYTFTLLTSAKSVPDSDTYMELQRLISRCKPIDSICNLVVLSPFMYLDCHCYLGINTRLPYYEQMKIGVESAPLIYLAE